MPRYHYKGPGQLERVDTEFEHQGEELPTPASPDVPAGDAEVEIHHECQVEDCGRRFTVPMLMARHFNATHDDLVEDDDTWREFAEEVEVET